MIRTLMMMAAGGLSYRPLTITQTGAGFAAQVGGDGSSTYTATAVGIGSADAARRVYVLIGWRGSDTLSSSTIGGVSATTVSASSGAGSGGFRFALIAATVPTGTTADIVAVFSSGIGFEPWVCAYRVMGQTTAITSALRGTATTSLTTASTLSVSPSAATLGGALFTIIADEYETSSHTIAGATLNTSATDGNFEYSAALLNPTPYFAPGVTWTRTTSGSNEARAFSVAIKP